LNDTKLLQDCML